MKPTMLDKFRATAVPPRPTTKVRHAKELDALGRARQSFLGIERQAKIEIESRIDRLRSNEGKLKTDYKRLSLEPLGWSRGFFHARPVFAMYSIHDAEMVIAGLGDRAARIDRPRGMPLALREAYAPAVKYLDSDIELTSTFTGVIPTLVRKQIAEAIPHFQERLDSGQVIDHVYILAEEKHWQTRDLPRPPRIRLDPLVVGWDGLDLWLITHFDLTDLERYMIEEFPAVMAPPDKPMLGA